jgi:PAS domain-containing protein
MSLDQTISASGAENRQPRERRGSWSCCRLAFETAPQATLQLDRNLVVTSANQAARTLLAASGAELEARMPGLVFGAYPAPGCGPCSPRAGEIGEYRGGTWQVKSAESIWEFTWTPITVQGGGSLGGTLVIQDMTRRSRPWARRTACIR